MPIQVLMPALSMKATKAKLVKWTEKEGEKGSKGYIIFAIETTKRLWRSKRTAILHILPQEGTENVAVNTPIALLCEESKRLETQPQLKTFLEGLLEDSGVTHESASGVVEARTGHMADSRNSL